MICQPKRLTKKLRRFRPYLYMRIESESRLPNRNRLQCQKSNLLPYKKNDCFLTRPSLIFFGKSVSEIMDFL